MIKNILFWSLLLILVPIVYVNFLDNFVRHPGLKFSTQWSDNYFLKYWVTSTNAEINGGISNDNGTLRVTIEGPGLVGGIVAAQRLEDLPVNLPTSNEYINVSIRSSSINVAARIVIWSDFTHPQEVLVKTYNDNKWHDEIVDLSYFHISGNFSLVELTAKQIYDFNGTEWVSYRNLSFNKLDL